MSEIDFQTPSLESPAFLRVWRGSDEERQFIQAWLSVENLSRESLHAAGLFHAATFAYQNRLADIFALLRRLQIQAQPKPLPLDHPEARRIERHLWAFLQTGKLMLDSLAREVNLVYWLRDEQHRFVNPFDKPRWVSFYTVRQQLLGSEAFQDDPLIPLLKRTIGETAEPTYQTLSHLANVSLLAPLVIGPILSPGEATSDLAPVSQWRVLLPDDPRAERLTYARGYEVNETGHEILRWSERFVDEVYAALALTLDHLVRSP